MPRSSAHEAGETDSHTPSDSSSVSSKKQCWKQSNTDDTNKVVMRIHEYPFSQKVTENTIKTHVIFIPSPLTTPVIGATYGEIPNSTLKSDDHPQGQHMRLTSPPDFKNTLLCFVTTGRRRIVGIERTSESKRRCFSSETSASDLYND